MQYGGKNTGDTQKQPKTPDMNITLDINTGDCIRCGHCVRVCPSRIFSQEEKNGPVAVQNVQTCIGCGHCVAACPKNAVRHSLFPPEKTHPYSVKDYPTPEQMTLLCKGRRSNRAFTTAPVPVEALRQIVETAHRAPTASNLQQVAFTVITDPARLRQITEFTLDVYRSALKKLRNPLLKPIIRLAMPDAAHYVPTFERLICEYKAGNDLILRGATAVILIHTPRQCRFGAEDANLAYQNGSLMAECLGVSQFYTGFVLAAVKQDGKGSLEKALGIDGTIRAGMALGIPEFRFPNYIDKKEEGFARYL